MYHVGQSLLQTGASFTKSVNFITKWSNYYIVGHYKYPQNYEKLPTITPFYQNIKLNKLHFLPFFQTLQDLTL